jgi:N-acetylgalactosamine kinase
MEDERPDLQPEKEQGRACMLTTQFRRRCERAATWLVRAPGRVNLLGEHTDYNGLPVLPMAIERNVMIAVAPRRDRTVRLFNTGRQFPARQYDLADEIPAYAEGDWGNYAKAAAQGLLRYCGARLADGKGLLGADLLVDGNVPCGAGLSSSSALVVANALALLGANEVEIRYEELAEVLAAAERYVGTLSGGMDQATSLLARAGHALRIDFAPLRIHSVPLPAGYSVVICHSLVRAEKSGAAKRAYNLRVTECRLACCVLERALGTNLPRGLNALGDLVALFPGRSLLDFLPHLTGLMPDRPLPSVEIAALIGTRPEQLRAKCGVTPEVGDRFAVVRRARHVLSEAERVNQAEEALRAGDAGAFGQLMDASHGSCRDDYDISCPELEELISIAKEAGAAGARLTGAGFGGCTVNLVASDETAAFLRRVDRYFYRSRLDRSARVGDYRFVFTPQAGASVIRL